MVGLRPISPARTLCRTKGAGLRHVPVTTQLLIHGKVFSGRPAFLDHSLQPSHQRSCSIHSVAFGAIILCPDMHKCRLWRGQVPAPSCLVCSMLLQLMAAAQAGCEGSDTLHRWRKASPTTLQCSARWCSNYQTLCRQWEGSRAIWINAAEAPGRPVYLHSGWWWPAKTGLKAFLGKDVRTCKCVCTCRLSMQAVCAQVCVHVQTWAAEYTCVRVGGWARSSTPQHMCLHAHPCLLVHVPN